MSSAHSLSHRLLVLLFALPLLSNGFLANNTAATSNLTSPSDPFRELRLHANSKPSEPICCLTPLTTEPLPTTAEFLSFEEWKSKQRELLAQAQAANQTPSPDAPAPDALVGASIVPSSTIIGAPEVPLPATVESATSFSPHFRVPLTDRFNYASLDCSARIHTSHRSARSPAAILSSKKDKYMLSPCSADPNFVVVELCDDIRIDTVQLANFEFFSGVFRDFKVSVAQTYTSDGQGWIEAGTYRAKNIRGVQSFHPTVELRPFYRYIRIDFLSHYSSEFYCPISLLRVYGLTQMEEWKWEVWQGGSENQAIQPLPETDSLVKTQDNPVVESVNETAVAGANADGDAIVVQEVISNNVNLQPSQNGPVLHDSQTLSSETHPATPPPPQPTVLESLSTPIASSQRTIAHGTVSRIPVPTTQVSSLTTSGEVLANSTTSLSMTPAHHNATNSPTLINASHSTSSSSSSSVQILVASSSSPPISSGESIYRTIMNRLAMLETNTTLYQQYVEEQTLQIREALRRLAEDVGRLEGISKSQQQVFLKTMQELELKRRQIDEERWELLIKVNHLADEVILEKRLGIAQLCLLLTVLVFMALTRGSRAALLDGTMHTLNTLGRRRTWSSADWSQKRWLSRSRTPTPMDYSTVKIEPKEDGREVTISSLARHEKDTRSSVAFPTTPVRSQTPRSIVRRPITPRRQDISRVPNENRPSGRLRRSNSHTTPASAMLSAKRFARTAHLHEVQLSAKGHGTLSERVNMDDDPLDLGDGSPKPRRKTKEMSSVLRAPAKPPLRTTGGEESDAGSWVDTEAGPDSDPDSDDAESEEGIGQDVELKPEFDLGDYRAAPMISAPPSRRRGHLEGHTPPSPASVMG